MSKTMLIVDDSKLARIVAGKALASLQPDWVRVEAPSAEDALALTQDGRRIDAALVDFNMPGMNGLELAAELRARLPSLPIAIITANVQDDIIGRARALGIVFVAKPLTADSLAGFIAGVAAGAPLHA